ncbi:MAG TPA: hypothetical protein VMW72_16650 [Sedimentisphaerales bacterium]|nr:hypothetical protein [Sedimentisphaerales bacterium]
MSEETTNKSIVVWHPSLTYAVPDIREWTSLCLFHDQVVLYHLFFATEAEPTPFLEFWQTRQDSKERLAFIDGIQFLAKHNVIRLITLEEISPVLTDVLKVHKVRIPPVLTERFRNFVNANIKEVEDVVNKEGKVLEALDINDAIMSCLASMAYQYPLVTNDVDLQDPSNMKQAETLSEVLAQSAICQLALPDVRAVHAEDVLEARTELEDELLEFRAGILKLTWLLHHQIKNKDDLEQIRHEADTLTNTKIKGSLLSLENRMRQHKKKRIRRMLFGTGRVLVEATKLFLPSGAAEKMISGGKGLLQLATELDSAKPPEDQVATYLYKLKGKLKYE